MRRSYIVALIPFWVSLMMTFPTHSEDMDRYYCPGLNATGEERGKHIDLLEYAALAEAAYKNLGQTTINLHSICPLGIPEQTQDIVIDIRPIPENVINKVASEFRESNSNWTLDAQADGNGEKFFACSTGKSLTERLYVAFRYVLSNEQLSFFVKVAIVGVVGLTEKQEIGVVELRSEDGERNIGIQGTDIFSIDEWNTSVQNLIESWDRGNSCIFPFAVDIITHFLGNEVAGEFDEYRNKKVYSLVGHSLGGAVVQSAAMNSDLENEVRNHHLSAEFKAYSFNSIGIDFDADSTRYRSNIVSVRVLGEILQQLQSNVGRSQIGHILHYGVTSGQPTKRKAVQLHKINSVKKKICNCLMDEKQMFEYGYR